VDLIESPGTLALLAVDLIKFPQPQC
jgi:hypothetical protein